MIRIELRYCRIVSFRFEQIGNETEPIVVCTASVTKNLSTISSCDERSHFSLKFSAITTASQSKNCAKTDK